MPVVYGRSNVLDEIAVVHLPTAVVFAAVMVVFMIAMGVPLWWAFRQPHDDDVGKQQRKAAGRG